MKDENIKEILEDVKRHLDYVEATKQASIRDNEMKAMYDYITNLQEDIKKLEQELERYKNNIKSAFEVINTQMKNLSKEEAENLRIIKFNLIKGSCTFEDLKTEEDYKY